jgi:hypothetical protein
MQDFLKLVAHPWFALPFAEAADGLRARFAEETEEPFGPQYLDDVFADPSTLQRDVIHDDPTLERVPTTPLEQKITRLLRSHEATVANSNREHWRGLVQILTEEEWAALWATNKHRNNIRTAIELVHYRRT